MKYLKCLLILFFTFKGLISFGQIFHHLDTIKLTDANSNIPILTSTENLILSLGCSSFMIFNSSHRIRTFPLTATDKDTSFCFNVIFYSKKGITYLEKDKKVRLRDIDFKRNRDVFIHFDKISFSRELTLAELMKIYHYTDENIVGSQVGIMAPYPMRKCRCFYQVNFSTGEYKAVNIELYFDCKMRLRFMSIGAYDF
jgi:hypothetical protein